MNKLYRVEWMHNGNWRMEEEGGGRFETMKEAKAYQRFTERTNPGLETRIVEVPVTPTPEISQTKRDEELIEASQGLLNALEARFMRTGCNGREESAIKALKIAIAKARVK